ncbi:MAG TPA: DUF4349 domain-containing protein [Polyangia bacterium]|jgi:hypothetical protein
MNAPPRIAVGLLLGPLVAFAGCGTMGESAAEPASLYPLAAPPPPVAEPSEGPSGTPQAVWASEQVSLRQTPRRSVLQSFHAGPHVAQQGRVSASAPPPTAHEKVIVSGQVSISTDDVAGMAAAVRAEALSLGGEIAGDNFNGDPTNANASVELRLPPEQVSPFIDWLASRATLEARRLSTQDVSRQVFDQALAIHNLEITMARLQELAKKPDAALKDVLDVEREMTRVRGDLERLRGEQRGLEDKIARATLAVNIYLRHGVHAEPEVKFELVPQLVLWHFVDSGVRAQDRAGGGLSVMFSRWFSLDLHILPRHQADPRSFLLTAAVQTYSDLLGGGRRRYGNPYLGLRLGGGTINDYGTFAYGADVGVEIVHVRQFLVQVEGRTLGLHYNHSFEPHGDIALEATIGVGVPF